MGCDMMVALGPATAQSRSLFGINCFGAETTQLRALMPQHYCADQELTRGSVRLPQVRQTPAVLGLQTPDAWGMHSGVNDLAVAVGLAGWKSRLPHAAKGLTGPDLVRLALERGHSARQAVDLICDLVVRFGLSGGTTNGHDTIFLVADGQEAYVVEAADRYWAVLQCQHVRAVSDVALIRQDWQRVAPGLAEQMVQRGWWQDFGTKVDFAGSLGAVAPAAALRRWGKATLLLAQHNGSLDVPRLRAVLHEHFTLCESQTRVAAERHLLRGSWVAELHSAAAPLVWYGVPLGEACLYFPMLVGAELPAHWADGLLWHKPLPAESLTRLQAQFDEDAEEFLAEAQQLRAQAQDVAIKRLAQVMMQRHIERWQMECYGRPNTKTALAAPHRRRSRPEEEDAAAYAFG